MASEISVFLSKIKKKQKKWTEDQNIPGLKKIIALQTLRTKYGTFQSKRDLLASYDSFFADDRIICMLPKALGKAFYNGVKRPIPLRLAQKNEVAGNLQKRLERALNAAYFRYTGTCSAMRCARVTSTAEQVVDNLVDCIAGAVARIPGKWDNVQVIHIKTGASAALPVYTSLPEAVESDMSDDDEQAKSQSKPETTPKKNKRKAEEADVQTPAKSSSKKKKKKSAKKSSKK
mmetsp:Transcript_20809/g.33987  ORF Transcript_20809/g.33987 Transcript_20809/m.33987 type:complete len:232 (-) Transcript_20809:105-800(-)